MAKNVISLDIYQIGNMKLGTPTTMGIVVKDIQGAIQPLSPTGNQAAPQGQTADPSIKYNVYSAFELRTPSNAGTKAYFTNSSVAAIISDINT